MCSALHISRVAISDHQVGARTAEDPPVAPVAACCRRVYDSRPTPVHPPWALDIETIVGVAITLLAVLMPVVVRTASRHRVRRRTPAVLLSARGGRPIPAGWAPREPDAA